MSLLTLNAGSSSLKFALFDDPATGHEPSRQLGGQIDGLGSHPRLTLNRAGGTGQEHPAIGEIHSIGEALASVLDSLPTWEPGLRLSGIGHRVVHGGPDFLGPTLIDEPVLAALTRLTPLAPLHQPFNLEGVLEGRRRFPGVPQVACFDTAFHRGHAFIHDTFALPRELYRAGVRRYGFHGLSYEFIAMALRELDPQAAGGRVVVAHLGSGASLCALSNGRSVASSMSFTPLDGLPMGTRPGHLDPGVLLWLISERGLGLDALTDLLYRRSGLKGLSGLSGDLRDLHASDSAAAAEAIDYFVGQLCQQIAAMAATLGGLDTLVFTAGIGENDALIRARTAAGLAFLGVVVDPAANQGHQALISPPASPVKVRIIATNEELMIARQVRTITSPSANGP